MSLKQRVNNLHAMGGDVAIPVLTAVNTASGVFPPLQAATNAALLILTEIKKFRGNKRELERFGKYIGDAMVNVVAAITSYDESNEKPKSWVESIKKLSEALERIQIEVCRLGGKMERQPGIRNFFSHMKNPSRLDDLKKDFGEALAMFQLESDLMVGAIANNQVLNELKYPIVPHHDSTHPCLPDTRIDLIERIMAWCRTMEDSKNRVLLLTAVAGAGKTSVVLSIAAECKREKISSSSFFFKAGEQSRPDHLFSGVARSLATHDAAYRASLISTLQEDPALSTAPFATQFEKLVAEPLRLRTSSSDRPMVIIIDALDECDTEAFPLLANILRKDVLKLPPNIKFFVTSRHFDLVDRFLSLNDPINRLTINLSDDTNMHDCTAYIRSQLRELKAVHDDLKVGIGEEVELVQCILERAGGLFIWISTVFGYMKVTGGNATKMLKKLLDDDPSRSKASAEEKMDSLYASILEKCNWKDNDFVHDYPIVMGAILIAQKPLSVAAWDAILSPLLESDIQYTLAQLTPLVSGVRDPGKPIRILHQSFRDFLTDRVDPQSPILGRFRVDARRENDRVALCCIKIMNKELSTMKDLGLIMDLSEKAKLPPIPQEALPEHVHYACRHFVHHLNQFQEPLEAPNGPIHVFLNEQILRWVEVCVRTEGYVSLSSFPEWAKLNVDRTSKEVIHMLANVFDNVGGNLAFFLRLQEACEMASDSVALCRCLVSTDSESYTPDLARALRNLFVSLDKVGRHSEALMVIEESVKFWRELVTTHPTPYTPDLARALRNLFVSLDKVGCHSKALMVIKESVQLWRELVATHPTSYIPDLARALRNLFVSLDRDGHHSKALMVIQESVQLWRELVATHPTSHTLDLAQALRNLFVSLDKVGRHSEALMVIKESVQLCRELVATHPTSYTPDLAGALLNLQISLDTVGHHSEALMVVEESVRLWRELVATHSTSYTPGLARALRNLFASLDKVGHHSEALTAIEESVQLWHELVATHPASYTPDLARALQNLFVSLDKAGRHSEALMVIKESMKLWRELVAIHPTSYTVDLAQALWSLKVSLDKVGRHSEALTVIEESVKLWRKLVAAHPTSYTPDLAGALRNLKVSLDKVGRHSEALMVIEESVKLCRGLVATHPTSYTPDLARSLLNLFVSLDKVGRHSEALTVIIECVKLCRELVATHPTSYTPDLARSLRNLFVSLCKVGCHSEALMMIEESVQLWRGLVATHPTAYTPDLAGALQNLNVSLNKIGRHSEALMVIEESVKLCRELVTTHPTSYTLDLAGALQNLNVSLNKVGRHSEALTVIEESVQLWRKLVATHSTSYTPDLARVLQTLKGSLDKVGRHSEALTVIEESVQLWRELVATHPTSFTPDLAVALGSLDVSLTNLGRHSEALLVNEESVKLWRGLVAFQPTSYTPGLAQALRNLEISLDNLGRHSEALLVNEEGLRLLRQ
ncbi:uncharacterized protein EI90DRAFT_198655 [Cantharellus anzutake]|uniref:uncharacterized protein n=1 Tax=Cantharellus anzutake TaxID=1750568 RepID=UPI001903AB06|nr:uncharacterized protein EI90DRAFT_198655 [Cantharellus anzutake]KAF8336609.1 hypothetical protein EI90DRAFT_198655 [Cantharellus anzutake]